MDAGKIRANMEKAEETISKKNALIAKRYVSIRKKMNEVNALGRFQYEFTEDIASLKEQVHNSDVWCRENVDGCIAEDEVVNKIYWLNCDLSDYIESIENAREAISEREQVIAKYRAQLGAEEERVQFLQNLPQVFKDFMGEVVVMWDEWDAHTRVRLAECRARMDELYPLIKTSDLFRNRNTDDENVLEYRRCRNYFDAHSDLYYMSEKESHRKNVKDAESLVLDLYNRVSAITGEMQGALGLAVARGNDGYAVINGIVEGSEGTAKVQSIGAGGWNIQRFHIRTLVHAM